jgi:hypothetical protein
MQNLRDKLLKAGLVSDEQAKRSETEPARPRRPDRPRDDRPREARPRGDRPAPDRPRQEHARGGAGGRPPPRDPHGQEAGPRIPKLPPLPGSREHQRLESRKQLEIDRKLRELAHANEIPAAPGEHTFYFVTRKGRLRRLEITPEQAGQLERGELAIVERREPSAVEHALVLPAVAEEMRALAEKSVRFLNTPGAAVGFMSDAELEAQKQADAAMGPEVADAPSAEASEPIEDADGATEASGESPPPDEEPST